MIPLGLRATLRGACEKFRMFMVQTRVGCSASQTRRVSMLPFDLLLSAHRRVTPGSPTLVPVGVHLGPYGFRLFRVGFRTCGLRAGLDSHLPFLSIFVTCSTRHRVLSVVSFARQRTIDIGARIVSWLYRLAKAWWTSGGADWGRVQDRLPWHCA